MIKKIFGVALALALTHCSKSGDSGGTSGGDTGGPTSNSSPTITYSPGTLTAFQNIAYSATPTLSASVTGCSVSPALPAGLAINTTTCAITGTPTGVQSEASYTVSATASGVSGSTTVMLSVRTLSAANVYGQASSFTSSTSNNGGVHAGSLANPRRAFTHSSGTYVADGNNNRVLYYPPNGTIATRVYGQLGSFHSNDQDRGGVTANGLSSPYDVAADAGGVYIVDSGNNRVLYYAGTSTTATRVYGQAGSFTTNASNAASVSADTLNSPYAVWIDAGGIYIVDAGNARVLYYAGTSTTASRVYGQNGSFVSSIVPGSPTADSLQFPYAVAADATGVYIADSANNRVLFYPGTSTTATRVYGQANFTSGTAGTTSATSLNSPKSIALGAGGVFVTDGGANRVLYYPGTSTTATGVFGQNGSFTSSATAVTQTGLSDPQQLSYYDDHLYVVDNGSHRVLRFGVLTPIGIDFGNSHILGFETIATPTTTPTLTGASVTSCSISPTLPTGLTLNNTTCAISGTPTATQVPQAYTITASGTSASGKTAVILGVKALPANRVYGQNGSYTTGTANGPGLGDRSLSGPQHVVSDASGIYVADTNNNRVLFYATNDTTASRVYGQPNYTSNTQNNGGISATSLSVPHAVAIAYDGIYIADRGNHRVLFYPGTSTTATRVYGQANFTSGSANRGGAVANNTLNNPRGIAMDATGLLIVDGSNHRVLHFSGTSVTPDQVYGQAGSYTTNTSGLSTTKFFNPWAVAADNTGVYVVDNTNHRALYFASGSTTATRVYGQVTFTGNTPNHTSLVPAARLNGPTGISVNIYGVWIADTLNHRVLFFPNTATTATGVFGQAGDFTTLTSGTTQTTLNNPVGVSAHGTDVITSESLNNRAVFY